jgi:hypothetical protein
MDAQAVIDSYINSVAARLPRRFRNDVGVELRTLLMEQLASAATAAGRAPDEKLATELVRGFGRPEEVAAEYNPRGFQIIEPEHTRAFVAVSAACVGLQWGMSLPAVFASRITLGEWWSSSGFGAFAWVGIWAICFGLLGWARRRFPVDTTRSSRPWWNFIFWSPALPEWRPVDRERVERRAELGALPAGVVATIFFVAPASFLGLFTRGGTDLSWALYDEGFRRSLLPVLIGLMVVRLALCAVAGFNAHLRPRLEVIRFALWVGFVGLLIWTVFGWTIFANPMTDSLFKVWLLVYLLVNVIQIVVGIRRALIRVRVPNTLA